MPLEKTQPELAQEEETEEEEHLSITQPRAKRKGVELAESIILITVIDSKEKSFKVPIGKPHKKRKKSKPAVEETPKKVKLLSSAMSVVKESKMHLTFLSLLV